MRRRAGTRTSYGMFVLPAAVSAMALVLIPLAMNLAISFTNWNLSVRRPLRFVGFGNYLAMVQDGAFWHSLSNTLLLTVEAAVLQLVIGIAVAVLFNHNWRGMGLIRALFLAPMMIAPAFVGMIWRLMLSDDFGIVKYLFQLLGIMNPPLWLTDPSIALQTMVIVSVWEWTAFVVLFAMAGLQAIPAEVMEAASLDGCGALRGFVSITLPMLRPTIMSVALFRLIDGFKIFDIIYTMTAGGPGTSTTTMSYFVYQRGIGFFELGYSSTLALVMVVLAFLLAAPLLRRGESVQYA